MGNSNDKNGESMKDKYLKLIQERQDEGRVSTPHQLTGLMISDILDDEEHKSLYMKMAKENDRKFLIELARDVADRPNVENKGAYFMKLFQKKKEEQQNNGNNNN